MASLLGTCTHTMKDSPTSGIASTTSGRLCPSLQAGASQHFFGRESLLLLFQLRQFLGPPCRQEPWLCCSRLVVYRIHYLLAAAGAITCALPAACGLADTMSIIPLMAHRATSVVLALNSGICYKSAHGVKYSVFLACCMQSRVQVSHV